MRRDITLPEIIEELNKLPKTAKITVDTKTEMKVVGFILKRMDNDNKQISEIVIPKTP